MMGLMYNWYNWPPGRLEPFPVQAAALYTSWLHPQKNIPVKLKKKSMQYTALIKTMILHFFLGIATQCEGLYVVHTWNPSHPPTNLTYISRPTFFGDYYIFYHLFLMEMVRGGGEWVGKLLSTTPLCSTCASGSRAYVNNSSI